MGQEILLDQSPAVQAEPTLGSPVRVTIALKEGTSSQEVESWKLAGGHLHRDEPVHALSDGRQRVRVTAWCNDSESVSSSLTFRVLPTAGLRGLMVDWCSRQGVDLADVSFKMTSGHELTAADTLQSLMPDATLPREDVIDVRAEPKGTARPDLTVQLPDMQLPSAVPKDGAAKPAAPRVQVRIAAEGILSERLRASTDQAGLSFKTKLYAPVSKVVAAWCKHHGLAADTIVVSYQGRALEKSDTPATHGWEAGTEVILEALHVSDPRAQPSKVSKPQAGQAGQASCKASEEMLERTALSSQEPGQDRPGRALLKVYDDQECIEFWMRPSTTFERMMTAWRQARQLQQGQQVRFELKVDNAKGLRAGDLGSDETPAQRGWSQGVAQASGLRQNHQYLLCIAWLLWGVGLIWLAFLTG